ncbi:hypothetical protein E4U42_001447, partial [Claviceps africana]
MDRKQADGGFPAAGPATRSTNTRCSAAEHIPSHDEPAGASRGGMPTLDSPFTFPTSDLPPLPPYSVDAKAEAEAGPGPGPSSSSSSEKPMAIPQLAPDSASPFLPAYPPGLLAHGITQQAWRSFLDTLSAFLTAKVSDRAVAHAGDLAKSLGEPPR